MKAFLKLIAGLVIVVGISGCGQATKITRFDSLPPLEAGPRLVILQEGVDENRLRAAMLRQRLNVSSVHSEQRGFNHEPAFGEAVADYYVKFSSRLNRPCIAPGSELIYGTAELINSKSGRSVISIEELGFNDSCLGTKAFYGDVYEKLAISIQKLLPTLRN